MLKKIALGFAVLVAAFLVFIAAQPSEFTVSRQVVISAPAEKIFPFINNSKLMNEWNPWMDLDRAAKVSFSGPDEGVGAKTSWEAGEQLGTGSATVTESIPNQLVRTKLEYVKPFEMTQDSTLAIQPIGAGNAVVWTVSGKNTFFGRLMCAFGKMDEMIGGTFEKGLNTLKGKVEKGI